MSWFDKLIPSILTNNSHKKNIPKGLWDKCNACDAVLFRSDLENNLLVCPKCDYHMRISARERIKYFLDDSRQQEIGASLKPKDRFKFKDTRKYKERLATAQKQTQENDALVVISGKIFDIPVVVASFEFDFIGGSMGTIVGQKFVLAVEAAIESNCALVCFAASGGARMQESLLSLMQMAKTSAALKKISKHNLPFISVMLNPCMGGVSASLAQLGDLNFAEPSALIGFSGPKIIRDIVKEELPKGFQTSESLLDNGFLDAIVDRRDLKHKIARCLAKLMHLQVLEDNT